MMLEPFVEGAKVQTMHRDFDALRKAIRSHDTFATEAAWDRCERWLGAVSTKCEREGE